MSKMAGMPHQADRFINFINQQLAILTEERNNVSEGVDDCIRQVQREVNAWVHGDVVNEKTCAQMNNRIQQVIIYLIGKSVELSGIRMNASESHSIKTSTHISTSAGPGTDMAQSQTGTTLNRIEVIEESGNSENSKTDQTENPRFSILEDALISLKETTEQLEEKQEHFDRILKDVTTQQENFSKKFEILTNANLKCHKEFETKISKLGNTIQGFPAIFDNLFETVTNLDGKLTRLEDENKSLYVLVNELNKQIGSATDDLFDLSRRVESTTQRGNGMFEKMNKMEMEMSMNGMPSQSTEHLGKICSLKQDKLYDFIGMVCQFLAKKLTPLEKIYETFSKVNNKNGGADSTNKVGNIDLKRRLPNVGFYAWKLLELTNQWLDVKSFTCDGANYGGHFDPLTGRFTAPLTGLYLISISTGSLDSFETFSIKCYQKSRNRHRQEEEGYKLCRVSANRSVTRCAEMTAGDVIYVKCKTFHQKPSFQMFLCFSCCMVKG